MKYDSHSFQLLNKVNKNYNNAMHTINILFEENNDTYKKFCR